MKENLNNNNSKINKSNLPSTWTKSKIASLFLAGWLSINGAEAGKAYVNCLSSVYNAPADYGMPKSFIPLDNNGTLDNQTGLFCCTDYQCTASYLCPNGTACISDTNGASKICNNGVFYCRRISQKSFCVDTSGSCGCVSGDTLITGNATSGNCTNYDLNATANYLSTVAPDGVNNGYAHWTCSPNSACKGLKCIWDNGGWTCFDFNNYFALINCYLQWKADWPGPADNNPLLVSASTSGVISSPTSSSGSTSSNNSGMPIPAWIGIGVGGIVIIGTSGVIYWKIKKTKERKKIVDEVKSNPKDWSILSHENNKFFLHRKDQSRKTDNIEEEREGMVEITNKEREEIEQYWAENSLIASQEHVQQNKSLI